MVDFELTISNINHASSTDSKACSADTRFYELSHISGKIALLNQIH